MATQRASHFEVSRTDTLSRTSAQHNITMDTYRYQLSSDGRTVASLRLSSDNLHLIEVWDSGKSVICRVCMNPNEHITAFVQARLINKNCLFVCVKIREGQSATNERHELRGYEIASNG